MTAYKPGDKIEAGFGGEWDPLGAYLATTSNGMMVVCEMDNGGVTWALAAETRLAPDTVTVTVEIDRQGAEEVAAFANDGTSGKARCQAFQAFIDAVTEAVRP